MHESASCLKWSTPHATILDMRCSYILEYSLEDTEEGIRAIEEQCTIVTVMVCCTRIWSFRNIGIIASAVLYASYMNPQSREFDQGPGRANILLN